MDIKWLGAAGFQISTGQDVFLLDPYLSRNPRALPRQDLTPSDLTAASRIFITHGHFDIGPFVDGVRKYHPKTKVLLPAFNRSLTL
jgi:L-ascorbate metabolism protein UlaG (beta-lactamase superfamily)